MTTGLKNIMVELNDLCEFASTEMDEVPLWRQVVEKEKISAEGQHQPAMAGYLYKEGYRRKAFRLRWFSLSGSSLVYSVSPQVLTIALTLFSPTHWTSNSQQKVRLFCC